MAHHPPKRVPQFGNWDENNDVPLTMVFDNARAGRGTSKMVNPNDSLENHTSFVKDARQQSDEGDIPIKIPKIDREQMLAERQQSHEPYVGRVAHRQSGDGSRTGAESPNHQVYQGRLGNRIGSPHRERKTPVESGSAVAPGTPGRSRFRAGSETPDRSTALPPFGAWETDPSAGDGFTIIFNQARDEKKTGGPLRIPPSHSDIPNKHYSDASKHSGQGQKKLSNGQCCCIC